MFTKLVNGFGLYTSSQYLERVTTVSELNRYIEVLERSLCGMSDPSKPLLIFGEGIRVSDVVLLPGQQIIVSPKARYVHLQNVVCQEVIV